MWKRFIGLILTLNFVFFLVGCEQKSEIVNLAEVIALGVDITADEKFMVSLRIIGKSSTAKGSPTAMGKSNGGGSAESIVYSTTGETIVQAVTNMNKQLGKEIGFSHNKIIIIGEEAARKGIDHILDYSLRLYQMRPNVPIFIARGTAFEILKIETKENPLPPAALEDIIRQQDKMGFSPNITNLDIANALLTETTAPIAGVIKKNIDEIDNSNSFKIEGTAVFRKEKLIGFMNEKQTRGLEWVVGRIRAGTIIIPSAKCGNISIYILDSTTKINPIINKEGITIEIKIKTKGNIREMSGSIDLIKEPDLVYDLNKNESKIIKHEVEETINIAQKNFKEDIFGFGEAIYRKYPKEWKSIKDKWKEEFPYCQVKVIVDCSIKRPGSIGKPIQ